MRTYEMRLADQINRFMEQENILLELGMTQETIDTIIGIYGLTDETYEDMLYYVTGYGTFDQLD